MHTAPITVVETPTFQRKVKALLSEEERLDLITYLAENPTSGALIEGTGGVRKARWARQGAGKSGGYRVIYYFHSTTIPLFALLIYGKNDKENLTRAEKNAICKLTSLLDKYGSKTL